MATLESSSRVTVDPNTLTQRDFIFLIDEAQQSYHDKDFWLGIIKTQSGRPSGIRIAIISSFGSPTGGPNDYSKGSAPVHFGVEQRVSIVISSLPSAPIHSRMSGP
jgi:hypothetical protein